MDSGYETVVGLEIHVRLLTRTKLFCSCPNEFGARPNTLTCPVCAGHPGALPVLNEKAVRLAIAAGLAFNCEIASRTTFDRKNYFYPDLPKGFQITQFSNPICTGGFLEVEAEGKQKRMHFRRIHIEEDSGKSTHSIAENQTKIDLNRCGIPLIEIVTEPDIGTPDEARQFLIILRRTLRYLNISDCEMQEGSLRCDVNVSVRRWGSQEMGKPVEIKNLGSFKMVAKAIDYEAERQTECLVGGDSVKKETRLWDDATGTTRIMRSKEQANDYRYFHEPDIPPLDIGDSLVGGIRAGLCELPQARERRFVAKLGLSEYDAGVLTSERETADYFEQVLTVCGDAKEAANWVLGETAATANERGGFKSGFPVPAKSLGEVIILVGTGIIKRAAARKVLWPQLVETGGNPRKLAVKLGLTGISDTAVESVVDEIIAANPDVAKKIRDGGTKAVAVLVGQLMKKTNGCADPQIGTAMFLEKIAGISG